MATARIHFSPPPDDWDGFGLADRRVCYPRIPGNHDAGSDHAVREIDKVAELGGGTEQKNLEAFIRKIGLGGIASCHAAIPYGDIQHIYRLCDVLVLPSVPTLGLREQFGLTLAEAMACGKPVVATRCGSMPWVVGDAGLLADPADSTSLAARLDQLCRSAELRAELGWKGRNLAEQRYDKNRISVSIGETYDAVLCGGRPR
jgi:glycosyltransferase involved in cell wall biosynthesis